MVDIAPERRKAGTIALMIYYVIDISCCDLWGCSNELAVSRDEGDDRPLIKMFRGCCVSWSIQGLLETRNCLREGLVVGTGTSSLEARRRATAR